MKRWDLGAGMFFVAFGGLVAWQSTALEYQHETGPGAGFLPFWLGVLFAFVGSLLLLETHLRTYGDESPWHGLAGPKRVLAYGGLFFLCVFLFKPMGFIVSVALFLLVSTRVLEGECWRNALLLSGLSSLTLYLVFGVWLQLSLPVGPLGF